MSFERASAKLTIASLDASVEVSAQYNPKELQVDKTVPWSKVNQANQSTTANAGGSGGKGIHLEFTGAEGRSMSVELLFDGYEHDGDTSKSGGTGKVKDLIGKLERMASVLEPDSPDENRRRPHRCVVTWGDGGMPSFRCVIESLSTKYTMFSSNGVPLRATCTVKLKEADVVSMAKTPPSGGAAPAPAGGAAPSGGGTPA
jgi:hypothetical protein